MQMEFLSILRVIWHWRSLVISILLVAATALLIRMRVTDPEYETQVKLQLTTPQIEEVSLFEGYRYLDVRDTVSVARNNLTQVLESEEIYLQTLSNLGLEEEKDVYKVEVEQVRDSDFLIVTVTSGDRDQTAEIANVHVLTAIDFFGELRSKPAQAERKLIDEQLSIAEAEYRSTEETFTNFKTNNNVLALENQIQTTQRLIEQLKLAQDRALFDPQPEEVILDPVVEGEEPVPIEELIAIREAELEELVAIQPEYLLLEDETIQAREKYQSIQDKSEEADLKVISIQAASFIQIAQPATPPETPEGSFLKALVLPLIGTLGFAVMLAFLFEYLLGISERRSQASLEAEGETTAEPAYDMGGITAVESAAPSNPSDG